MSGPARFRRHELYGADAPDDELEVAAALGRELDDAIAAQPEARPSAGFADRVMAAIDREPGPTPAAFLAPLRRRSLRGLVASVQAALSLAARGGRPVTLRVAALAYALAVLLGAGSVTGLAAAGAAGALQAITAPRSAEPTTEATERPGASAEPGESGEPGESAEPGDSQDAGDPGASGGDGSDDGAAATGSTSEDGGDGTASPSATPGGSGGEGGGSPTATPSGSPRATDTPRPSGTPKATESPSPSPTSAN